MRKYTVPETTTLTYLLGDHLGSTSLAVDSVDTTNVIETRYKPWGEVRFTTEDLTLPTRYTFTGQYSYVADSATDLTASASFGLMFYNARWYDPALGRFAQADTIVPGGV
jgi:RHS repeat-associated protein